VCDFICRNGQCSGTCSPGTWRCVDTLRQWCDEDGIWVDSACDVGLECMAGGTCKTSDLEPCESADECASGACSAFYMDTDGDGFGAAPISVCGSRAPVGYVATPGDCCDTDANARPGQENYYGTPRIGCGGYDYNCANGEERRDTTVKILFGCWVGVGWYVYGDPCLNDCAAIGYPSCLEDCIPSCGATALWEEGTSPPLMCPRSQRVQACR
jgi:hypothetical protein